MRELKRGRGERYYALWAACTALFCVGLSFSRAISEHWIMHIFGMNNTSIFERLGLVFWPLIVFILISEIFFRDGTVERKTVFLLAALAGAGAVFSLPGTSGRITTLAVCFFVFAIFYTLCFLRCSRPAVHSIFSLVFTTLILIILTTLFAAWSLLPPENFFFY